MRILSYKFNIHEHLRQYLLQLWNFEIVIVCDDSGSMMTPIDSTMKTRWEQLHEIVRKIVQIAVIFDSNGVDIYFLNGDEYLRIKNPADVDHAFTRTPRGYTPLVPVLRKIFESPMARPGRDKKY